MLRPPLRGEAAPYQPLHLLRLARAMEKGQHGGEAAGVYRVLVETYPTSPDVEMALYRMALAFWDQLKDADNAKLCLREMAKRFPKGEMATFGRDLWNRIEVACAQA